MIQNLVILLVSACVLYVSFVLFSRAAGTLSVLKLNTVSYVFYVQIVLLTFVGSILAACGYADFHYLVKPVSQSTKVWAWVGVLYSMIAMPIAMIMLNMAFNINASAKFKSYVESPIVFAQGPVLSTVLLSGFVVLSAGVLLYTFSSVESVPLFTALKGDIESAAIERVEVRRNFGGIEYIPNLLGYLMMPIFAYFSAIYAFVKRKFRYWIFFFLLLFLASLFLAYDTQKAPIVLFFIGFMVLNTLVTGGFSRTRFILYGSMCLLLIVAGYALTTEKDAFAQIVDPNSALWSRVFITEYGGYLLSLELFPDVINEPTWQIGLPTFILDFFGLKKTESARLLMIYMNPEGVAKGDANLISSYYLAEAWANYGWVGLMLAPFVVGFVVQAVHLFLLKNRKEPLIMAFYSYVTVRWLLNSGFVGFLYLKIILYPVLFYFIFRWFMKMISNQKIASTD